MFIWGGNEEQVQWLDFTYVFPLVVGETWHASVCGTAAVVQQHSIEVPGDGVRSAFFLTHRGGCLNVYFDETREFVPGVGLTSAHWTAVNFAWRNETWKLLEFDLPSNPNFSGGDEGECLSAHSKIELPPWRGLGFRVDV